MFDRFDRGQRFDHGQSCFDRLTAVKGFTTVKTIVHKSQSTRCNKDIDIEVVFDKGKS